MGDIQTIRINNFELKLADSDDPIASKVSWSPAKSGGANFKTQHMETVDNKILVRRSAKATVFGAIFMIPGLGAMLIGAPWLFMSGNILPGVLIMIWGGMFGGGGWLICRDKKLVFDKSAGVYFRGKAFNHDLSLSSDIQGSLANIHAIQLLSEQITSDNDNGSSTYLSYELNLVFKNGERTNVMDSGDGFDVEKSAKTLAQYLGLPVWKAQH